MKTTMTLLTGLALAISAQAGEDYSAKGGKEVIAPPAPSCLWSWFSGGSVGYVSGDWDEEIYTLHFGAEYKCPGSNCSQAIFLEVGYTEKDTTIGTSSVPGGPTSISYDLEAEVIPITLNYKYECALTGNLNWYVGAGVGIALVDLSVDAGNGNTSYDDTVLYGHLFAGIVYNVSESFEAYLGARYIVMDDPSLTGVSMLDDEATLDGDIHFELGGRFNF